MSCPALPEQGRPSLPLRSFWRPNSSESTSRPNWQSWVCDVCMYVGHINALAVAMSFNIVFALITLFKLRFKLILFNCYCIKMLMLKVFAQQMLWHFRS